MSEDHSSTRPYEPGAYPPPHDPGVTRPFEPGTGPAAQYPPPAGGPPPQYAAVPWQAPYYGPPPYQQPYPAPDHAGVAAQRAKAGQRSIVVGALLLVGGLLLSLLTYSAAAKAGGVYFVAYGPVIYGVYRIVAGIVMVVRSKR